MDYQTRRAGLLRMRAVALGLLIFSAVVFGVSFALEVRYPWMGYVRAAAEGAMVGGLADWFAVTALFRRPMGLPIPHTALIERKKDSIGQSLSEFIAENFLDPSVVSAKLSRWGVARRTGHWLSERKNADSLIERMVPGLRGALNTLSDDDVQRLLSSLARDHMLAPVWAPTVGALLGKTVAADHHRGLVDVVVTRAAEHLRNRPALVARLVGQRAPSWVPDVLNAVVADRVHTELVRFAENVRDDPHHEMRRHLDEYLDRLSRDLQRDPEVIATFERFKHAAITDPLVRDLAASGWNTLKEFLIDAAEDPGSDLRRAATDALVNLGQRILDDPELARNLDGTAVEAVTYLVRTYREEISSIVSETVSAWDAKEASEKIELHVGRDLQFIRINGTVIGALAGCLIFTVAHLLVPRV